jgi:hypothetical protein
MKDEAGPLWILLENSLDWLGFWGRIALSVVFVLAVLAFLSFATRRKS